MGLSINLALGEGKTLTFTRNALAQVFIGTPEYPTSLLVCMAGLIQHYYIEWVAMKCIIGIMAVVITIKVTKKVVLTIGPQLMDLVPSHGRGRIQPPVSVDYRDVSALFQDGNDGTRTHDGRDHGNNESCMPGLDAGVAGNQDLRKRHQQGDIQQQACSGLLSNGTLHDRKGIKSGYVLLKADGSPWDVDVIRRYLCYTFASFILGQYALFMQRVERVAKHTMAMT